MMHKTILIAGMLLIATPANAEPGTAVGAAEAVCQVLTNTGMTSGCEVSGWNATVDVIIDMDSAEARQTCSGVVEMIAAQTRTFHFERRTWQLRILSPYGTHPIAVCDFR